MRYLIINANGEAAMLDACAAFGLTWVPVAYACEHTACQFDAMQAAILSQSRAGETLQVQELSK